MRHALCGLLLACGIAQADQSVPAQPDPELRAALIAAVSQAGSFAHRFDAEVWLVDMSARLRPHMPDEDERLTFLRLLHAEASRAQLAPELVLAVIDVESRFDRYAISSAGAQGLMQVMPFWLNEIGLPEDNLFHMQTNLRMGCAILRFYLEKEGGNLVPALARYNGSHGQTWYAERVTKALTTRWYRP